MKAFGGAITQNHALRRLFFDALHDRRTGVAAKELT
jgi:hypothetical protein